MVNLFTKLRQSSPNSSKGFTLVELIVTTLISSMVLGLSLQLITDQRKQFVGDRLRSESGQTLRAGMDLIGTDARLAGDFLESDSELPVISVIDESDSSNATDGDILVLQRKMISDTLKLCRNLSNGEDRLRVARNPTQPGCGTYSDGDGNDLNDSVDAFRNYRCQADGNNTCDRTSNLTVGTCDDESVWAYIHDPVNNRGEFFRYSFERSNAANTRNLLFRCDSSTWLFNYTYNSSNFTDNPTIYILEERTYSLNGDVLQLTENRQAPALRLTNNIAEFEVDVVTDSGSENSFNPGLFQSDDWQSINYLNIALEAADTSDGASVRLEDSQRQISSRFYPRNASSKN